MAKRDAAARAMGNLADAWHAAVRALARLDDETAESVISGADWDPTDAAGLELMNDVLNEERGQ